MKPTTHICKACSKPRERFGVVLLKGTGAPRFVCLEKCFGLVLLKMLRREGVIEA
jgi:hypothetical protein